MKPNSMAITQDVVNALSNNAKVIERLKYTTTATDDEVVSFLKKSFGIQNVHVVDAFSRAGNADIETGALTPVAEKKILIYYSSTEELLMPLSFGTLYQRSEAVVWTVSPDERTRKLQQIEETV